MQETQLLSCVIYSPLCVLKGSWALLPRPALNSKLLVLFNFPAFAWASAKAKGWEKGTIVAALVRNSQLASGVGSCSSSFCSGFPGPQWA